jgi:hypothetical protein
LKKQAEDEQGEGAKRRKLQDIEDELMGTEDAKRTAELFQEHMIEHKGKGARYKNTRQRAKERHKSKRQRYKNKRQVREIRRSTSSRRR